MVFITPLFNFFGVSVNRLFEVLDILASTLTGIGWVQSVDRISSHYERGQDSAYQRHVVAHN